jgi:type I restriction enzyme S subunit
LAEQHQLLEQARMYVASIEGVKALQAETAVELGAMLPAILDKAFKGELA